MHPASTSSASPVRAAAYSASASTRAQSGYSVAEPREEIRFLGPRARERLVEVVVRVDEAGRDQAAAEVLEVLRERRGALADLDDEAVLDQDPGVVDLGAGVVHRDDVGVREERPHGA